MTEETRQHEVQFHSFRAMRLLVVVVLLAAAVLTTIAAAAKSTTTMQDDDDDYEFDAARIFGGEDADADEYPSQVHIDVIGPERNFGCGGTILTEKWILTAMHCVYDGSEIYVTAGSRNVSVGKRYAAKRFVGRTEFRLYGRNDNNAAYDIALLKLHKPLRIDHFSVIPARLPQRGRFLPSTKGVVVGWGLRKDDDTTPGDPDVLQKLDVNIIPCPRRYEGPVICINSSTGSGLCGGDSGSALFIGDVVFGITSFADHADLAADPNERCGQRGSWAVVTAVADFRDWIRHYVGV